MSRARRAAVTAIAVGVALTTIAPGGPASAAAGRPALRLIAADPSIAIVRHGHRAWLDVGVYVAAAGGAFELRIERPDYDHPLEVRQHVAGGTAVPLPASVARSLVGLRRFVRVTITDPDGSVVLDRYQAFCPASAVRVNDGGPPMPTYPGSCSGSPFTVGTVWGIDDGWATNASGSSGIPIKGPDGRYSVRISIPDRYVDLFAIPPEDATATVTVNVLSHGGGGASGCPPRCEDHADPRRDIGGGGTDRVPTMPDPPSSVEPDLVALPAWSIAVSHRRQRDFLEFAATVWNAGSAPLVVEGFRRPGEDLMDAFQYFIDGTGTGVGKAPVGDLGWDTRRGHQHWHFMQFARYSLLDAARTTTIVSRKEAFCLAPTDAIDLLAPGAEWTPGTIGLGASNCGSGPTALWVREVLPVGWGDTYFQGLPGQSFDITDLPNGRYSIAVEANPLGLLHEGRTDNNVELREVILGGAPGSRTVRVPPWHGIDTEGTGGGDPPVPMQAP